MVKPILYQPTFKEELQMTTIYTEIELKELKMKELRNILKNQYIMLEPVRTKTEAIQIILRLQNTEATPYFK